MRRMCRQCCLTEVAYASEPDPATIKTSQACRTNLRIMLAEPNSTMHARDFIKQRCNHRDVQNCIVRSSLRRCQMPYSEVVTIGLIVRNGYVTADMQKTNGYDIRICRVAKQLVHDRTKRSLNAWLCNKCLAAATPRPHTQ
eukprot:1339831-Amphidinium_carterae.1